MKNLITLILLLVVNVAFTQSTWTESTIQNELHLIKCDKKEINDKHDRFRIMLIDSVNMETYLFSPVDSVLSGKSNVSDIKSFINKQLNGNPRKQKKTPPKVDIYRDTVNVGKLLKDVK